MNPKPSITLLLLLCLVFSTHSYGQTIVKKTNRATLNNNTRLSSNNKIKMNISNKTKEEEGDIFENPKSLILKDFSLKNQPSGNLSYFPFNVRTKPKVVFNYSYTEGANRPSADITFYDGFELSLISSGYGDFFWCIRDEESNDIGFLKLTFDKSARHMRIELKRKNPPKKYQKYLDLLPGIYTMGVG